MIQLTSDYRENVRLLDSMLEVDQNFDIVKRPLYFQGHEIVFYFIDGFVKDDIMERIMEFLLAYSKEHSFATIHDFSLSLIPYVEVDEQGSCSDLVTAVLSGSVVMLAGAYREALIIDARTYPTRGMSEPEDDKVLRGSRDGFVETLVFNTALIRRRIRDTHLRMEYHNVGTKSKTDVVLCYLSTKVDAHVLKLVRERMDEIRADALTMAQESLAEALVHTKWYNPFPKVRYTERPDAAASNILEGKLVLIIDNSPSVLILPTSFFDFVQEAQDYYLPPLTGTYLRIVRIMVFLLTLFITPLWYLMNSNPDFVPSFLKFIIIKDTGAVSIIWQFLILEFGIDALKMASLNTPSSLNSSFSIIGALILGDFAVGAGWFAPEVILYMAFVALANFTQPSYELGYAIKFMRVMLLVFTAIGGIAGFVIGLIVMGLIIAANKTITETSYLYPLIPFQAHDFKMIFLRRKLQDHDAGIKDGTQN